MLNYKTVNGYQIPDLTIPDGQVTLGKYGRMQMCIRDRLIDEETAPIVRLIFGYALNGHGPNYILSLIHI